MVKITYANGDITVIFEGTIEEWLAFDGQKDLPKVEYQDWMEDFIYDETDHSCSFASTRTKEGHTWWVNNYDKPAGLSRLEEMKKEYAAWKATQ